MAGKRQPTDLVKQKGKKHLGKAEEDARRDREVHVPPPDAAMPPRWLAKKFHQEFREIGEILRSAGLYAEIDRDVLAQYFVARERWQRADKLASSAIRDKDEKLAKEWTTVQGTYFKQARQCAEVMGLSVTSRCRIVVPEILKNAAAAPGDDSQDEFTQRLRARQEAALSGVK
ncbi:phage terminase small subunit P27 family [Oscillibacter sp.]|uniref:phage terminase small subunit P27 family n=1 Tax=Oscillibacter sp. TaxID=1945593 RepID=UPI0033942281